MGTFLAVAGAIVVLLLLFALFWWLNRPLRLVDNWRSAWRTLTVHVSAFWALVLGTLAAAPDALNYAWGLLPMDLRGELPAWARGAIAAGLFLASLYVARVVRQGPPKPPPADR